MLLQDALTLFLGEYKPTTRRAYESGLQPMINWLGAGRHIGEIRRTELIEYVQKMESGDKRYITHPTRPTLKKGLSVNTINKNIKSIKVFFNWLVKNEELERSPAAGIKYRDTDKSIPKEKAASEEEIDMIIKAAFGNKRAFAMINFLVSTGCRAMGVAGLRIQDINFERMEAIVTEKGDKTREVWFDQVTAIALREWLLKRGKRDHDYVFGNKNGKIRSESVSQIVRRYALKAGVRSLGAHSLRHAKGHALSDAKIPPQIAAQILGHENYETTIKHYYPADKKRAEEAARSLHRTPHRIVRLRRDQQSS